MRHRLTVLAIALIVIARAPVAAQTATEPQLKAAQLTGEWTGTLVLDNGSPRLTLVFDAKDSTFTGKVYSDGDLMGEMEEGRITGSKLHFKLARFDFTGTVNGARMQVDLIVYNGSTRKLTLLKTPA